MKYMLTWSERRQGTLLEYENAQKRILHVFRQWKAPAGFKIETFHIRVGDWGGYMLLDCDDPTAVHKFCSMLPAFVFEGRPVIPIDDAVRVGPESMAFRDSLKPGRPNLRISLGPPDQPRIILLTVRHRRLTALLQQLRHRLPLRARRQERPLMIRQQLPR